MPQVHNSVIILFFAVIGCLRCQAERTSSCPFILSKKHPRQSHKNSTRFLRSNNSTTPRIVGGAPATGSLHRYMVQLRFAGSLFCSGTVLNDRYVLTAAHCSTPIAALTQVVFYNPKNKRWTDRRRVSKIIPHPKHVSLEEGDKNDVMLLRIFGRVPRSARFVSVNFDPSIPEQNAVARVAGFGHREEGGSPNDDESLRQVDVPCRSNKSCKQLEEAYDAREHICASYKCGGCDSCQGDSGGPIFQFDTEGNVYQIGIVSFGIGCARPSFPGVYSRLSTFADWILNTMEGADGIYSDGDVPQVKVKENSCPGRRNITIN